jgi:saccharopine dehydrogenase-like NADP-dependent oxidoreductase
MKILVFGGSGKIGAAVGWDLVKRKEVTSVGLVGRNEKRLQATSKWIGNPKIQIHKQNVLDLKTTAELMSKYDVGISTLPDRRTSYALLEAAITAGLDLVDVLEEYHRRPDPYEIEGLIIPEGMTLNEYGDLLHDKALNKGITFLDGIGFAPGISNIMVEYHGG